MQAEGEEGVGCFWIVGIRIYGPDHHGSTRCIMHVCCTEAETGEICWACVRIQYGGLRLLCVVRTKCSLLPRACTGLFSPV